jgi:hypothetical protein
MKQKNEVIITIIAMEAKLACKNEPDPVERIKKAMRLVKGGHWLSTDENILLQSAICAAFIETKDETEQDRIVKSANQLQQLSALLVAAEAGLAVDPQTLIPPEEDNIPLLALWREIQ